MWWFRRKNDGKARPEDGVRQPAEEPRGGNEAVRGDEGAAKPQPPSTVHPMDAVALGLDKLGLASAGVPDDGAPQDGRPAETAHVRGDGDGTSRPSVAPSHERGEPGEVDPDKLREAVIEVLRTVYDPEIPVNIYEIGLVYKLDVSPEGNVDMQMTLTSPMCPVAESLPPEVEAKVACVPGVNDVKLDLVWDPPWNPSMMSEEARLLLNIG